MKKIFGIVCALAAHFNSVAQTSSCGIVPLPEAQYNRLKQDNTYLENSTSYKSMGVFRDVALNINIMVYDNGPITTVADVQEQIDSANIYFANSGIQFSICHVNYIVNTSTIPFWDVQYEYQLAAIYDLPGYINMYYVNYIPNASAYAYYPYPSSPDRVIMGQHLPGEIFAHELGHSFYLIHTHGNYNQGNATDELVNGSNCTTAADLLCDTPADPNLFVTGRVDTLCNYTDTVTVDSLGFLYNPDTHNIMSYTLWKCMNHFSSMQYNRMAYTLAHERAYLKSGEQLTATLTAPATACVYDTPIQLSGTPAGGTFSGPGVSGNMFDPSAAGGGFHIIYYTLPASAPIVESTDQYYQYMDTTYTLNTAWQSFTTAAAENLVAFSFYLRSAGAQTVYVSLYDGNGTSGNLLLQDTLSIPADSIFNWNKFIFQNPVHLNSGSQYTVAITMASAIDFGGNKNNVYSSGQSNFGSDLSFITHVLPDASPCGNSVSAVIKVSAPPSPVITNLLPLYCATAPAQNILANPGGGIATIDGVVDSVINPVVLGSGIHTLYYTYTDAQGCSNDSTFTFTINDTTAFVNAPSSLCTSDAPVTVTAIPVGGTLYLDNVPVNPAILDPATLSIGQHVLSYAINAEYPWIDTVDQDNIFTSFNALYSLSFGQTAWQSFTAGLKGYLNKFDISYYVGGITSSTFQIYKGEGTTGPLLYTGTMSPAQQTYDQVYLFPANTVVLEKDSLYTFEFGLNPIVNNINIPYKDQDPYPAGNCNLAPIGLPGTDFSFRTHINAVYQCGQDSILQVVTVSPPPIVNLGPDVAVQAGAQVILSATPAGCSYVWSTGDTLQNIIISGPPGSNVIYVTVNCGGCSASDTVVVDFITGIEEASSYFQIYPNPVEDVLSVKSFLNIQQAEILNVLGQQVATPGSLNTSGAIKIPTGQLLPGVYILRLKVNDKKVVQRFIKK